MKIVWLKQSLLNLRHKRATTYDTRAELLFCAKTKLVAVLVEVA